MSTRATGRPTAAALVDVGLDPALARAVIARDPLAARAAAGLMSNQLIAEALGFPTRPFDPTGGDPVLEAWAAEEREGAPRGDGHHQREPDDTRADEGRKEVGGGIHRDIPDQGPGSEGSGEHGRLEPEAADHAAMLFWRGVAETAAGMGLTHAAAHMRHYLDNSGATLEVDLDAMEATCPVFADDVAHSRATLPGDMMEGVDEAVEVGTTFEQRRLYTGYFLKTTSLDWYFAVGGSTRIAHFQAQCTELDVHAVVDVAVEWVFEDRYNWDEGKSVDIGGITVDDSALGRLHAVGLAQEYDLRGTRTDRFQVRLPRVDGPTCPGRDVRRGHTPPSDDERGDVRE